MGGAMNPSRLVRFVCTCMILSLPAVPLFSAISQDTKVFIERRSKLAAKIESGIAIIQSTERNQDNVLEFFVPNSNNHDFIYLTGLETPNATLILCPGSDTYPEILYIDGDPETIKKQTGIGHVYPPENLLPDLSNAYTDYSQFRFTQLRFKPLPSEISRILYNYGGKKVIYFNYPRFVNLAEPPPKRLEFISRIQYFSPKYEIRDVSDPLDELRMYHDEYALRQLKEAVRITGKAVMECIRSAAPGMTEGQLKAVFTFACHYEGAESFGFPTTLRSGPREGRTLPTGGPKVMKAGEVINIDCGAEFNHYTADIKRTFPVDGKFTSEQKKIYTILLKAHKACIEMVRPGTTMKDLQDKAMEILDAEGGYGKYFRWGTSHFLGMEVHDHGNNLIPFKPGIAITVEPGIVLPTFSIEFEDDVVCTETGFDWLSGFIPIEIEEVEKLAAEEGIGEIYFRKN